MRNGLIRWHSNLFQAHQSVRWPASVKIQKFDIEHPPSKQSETLQDIFYILFCFLVKGHYSKKVKSKSKLDQKHDLCISTQKYVPLYSQFAPEIRETLGIGLQQQRILQREEGSAKITHPLLQE